MQTARDVLRYFLRNRDAVDSLEGIARFRIADEAVYWRVADVSAAVEWLVSAGLLIESRVGRDRLFSLNEEQQDEARAFAGGGHHRKRARRV